MRRHRRAKAGNVASDIASRTFLKIVKDGIINGEPVRELTERAVYQANELVYEKAYENAEYGGMGTTLVAAVVVSNNATIVNVGDSRCYLVNESGIVQITKDHSLVEDMIDREKS
jgi:protein phosphatase